MNKIILKRKTGYYGILRKLKIWIDGDCVDSVDFRKEKELEISPGLHRLQVSMDWCKSRPLDLEVKGNENVVLRVSNAFLPLSLIFTFLSPSSVFKVTKL